MGESFSFSFSSAAKIILAITLLSDPNPSELNFFVATRVRGHLSKLQVLQITTNVTLTKKDALEEIPVCFSLCERQTLSRDITAETLSSKLRQHRIILAKDCNIITALNITFVDALANHPRQQRCISEATRQFATSSLTCD